MNIAIAMPEIALALAAMALMMVGAFHRKSKADHPTGLMTVMHKDAAISPVHWLGELCLLAVLVLVALSADLPRALGFHDTFIVDPFARYVKILILLSAVLCLIVSRPWLIAEKLVLFEYPILVLFACIGMLVMVSANDLIMLYMGLELQSLSLYVLAAIQRDRALASEAGLKYFVLGAVASGLILFGCSYIYGFLGSTGFVQIADALSAQPQGDEAGIVVGLVFLICGLAFKISAVPFHMWTPDVYQGAPTSVTAFFAVAPKIAALALFIRVVMGAFGDAPDLWHSVIVLISIGSMMLGALAALVQRNIKRLLAYSSIGHMGYALMGLASGTVAGVQAILIYLTVYIFMNIGVFALVMRMRRNGQAVEDIGDLAGLAKVRPLMALALLILMFSMAGIPPLAGFFGKFYVFLAAIDAGLVMLAVIGVLSSVIAAVYYLRIVKIMYFDQPEEESQSAFDECDDRRADMVIVLCVVVTVGFFLISGVISDEALIAAEALAAG
ncbi:MAG: NADH-quinone oxidoreductase subunit NuoN [Pseudomonadota bacterium]